MIIAIIGKNNIKQREQLHKLLLNLVGLASLYLLTGFNAKCAMNARHFNDSNIF